MGHGIRTLRKKYLIQADTSLHEDNLKMPEDKTLIYSYCIYFKLFESQELARITNSFLEPKYQTTISQMSPDEFDEKFETFFRNSLRRQFTEKTYPRKYDPDQFIVAKRNMKNKEISLGIKRNDGILYPIPELVQNNVKFRVLSECDYFVLDYFKGEFEVK